LLGCSVAQGGLLAEWAKSSNPEDHFSSKGILKVPLGASGAEYILEQAFVDDGIPGCILTKVATPWPETETSSPSLDDDL
jgi:hypothetical protein